MKKQLTVLLFLLFSAFGFAQENKGSFKEYSYDEFFNMIEEEQDTLFTLKDAIIKVNPETDNKYLVKFSFSENDSLIYHLSAPKTINKAIELTNVHFKEYFKRQNGIRTRSGLYNIVFEKSVDIDNTSEINIEKCTFNNSFFLSDLDPNTWPISSSEESYTEIYITQSEFRHRSFFSLRLLNSNLILGVYITNNIFSGNTIRSNFSFFDLEFLSFRNNIFSYKQNYDLHFEQLNHMIFESNSFNGGLPDFYCIEIEELIFQNNNFNVPTLVNFKAVNNVNFIGGNQFNSATSSSEGFNDYRQKLRVYNSDLNYLDAFKTYESVYKIENSLAFEKEVEQKSVFYNYFKNNFNTKEANKYYTEIKTLETQRIAYEHNLNPTFQTFFKLRINQFLKTFSNYGTEPERAVIVSLYVIMCFALIYLFFPNSWDKHGKNRIINRYKFFTKYMNRKAGIHEVYLEDKKEDLLEYEEFKTFMTSSGKNIPKFFMVTSLPLYKWAISGTKLSASLLKRVDIMKGSWNELPKSKRIWKSILLISAFVIAVVYDIFIKMLNALMLSINTFTTLGFGEIPIKGLPRYLAIIQGFIGWFMLTIFSVSLISQLLN